MPSINSVPKRNRRTAKIIGALLFGTTIALYFTLTHVSALVALRWFMRELDIPVEVRSASWDVRIGELFAGKIRDLRMHIFYKPLEVSFIFNTPVEYKRNKNHWSIQLAPTLAIGDFPPAQGTVTLELDVVRKGRKTTASGAEAELHLHQIKPLLLKNQTGTITADAWNIDGVVRWAKDWRAELEFQFKKVKAANAQQSLAAKSLKISTKIQWSGNPPLPFDLSSKLAATDLELLSGALFIAEPRVDLDAAFNFDGHRFEQVDIAMNKPFHLGVRASFGDGSLRAVYDLHGELRDLFTERAAKWLEPQVPALRRAKADGTLSLKGRLKLDARQGYSGDAILALNAKTFELPARDLFFDDIALRLPLAFPSLSGWGTLGVKNTEFHSVKLKNLALRTRLSTQGVDLTTEDREGEDHPIRQSVWGGSIDIANLFAHFGGAEGTEFTASVTGGPFAISAMQSDLCFMPDHPLKGSLSFTYPEIVQDHDSIALAGDTNIVVFNGVAHIGDLRLSLSERSPRLHFDLDWSDLDLHAIGEWTNIGDMRGSLSGQLADATFALTPVGPVPLAYEFTVRGHDRGGHISRFYGRAVDNIVSMLAGGSKMQDDLPWLLKAQLDFGKMWRNLMPATARYLGFHAKASGDWTELTTFDPPEAPCDSAHPEKHFLLCGTAFTIPLNTHGVYPVIMKTDAFQGWLAGMVQYFKGSFNNGKKQDKEHSEAVQCTPPW